MDADRTLEVLIKIGLITPENADKARDAIAGVKEESVNAADSTRDLSKNVSDAGESMEGTTRHGRELHLVFSQLDRLMPGLGMGLRGMSMGPIAGIGATIYLVNLLINRFEELKKKAEEVSKASADSWLEQADALNAAAASAKEYFDTLNKISEKQQQDADKKAAADKIETTNAQIDDKKKLLDAMEKDALAGVSASNRTKEEKEAAANDIKRDIQNQRDQLDLEKQQGAIDTKQRELDKANRAESDLYFGATAAENAVTAAKSDKNVPTNAELKSAGGEVTKAIQATGLALNEFNEKLEAANKRAADAAARPAKASADFLATGQNQQDWEAWRAAKIKVTQDEVTKLQAEADAINTTQAKYNELNKKIEDHNATIRELTTAAEDAKTEYGKNAAEIKGLTEEIKTAKTILAGHQLTAKELAATEAGMHGAAMAEGAGIDIAKFIESGGNATEQQKRELENLASRIAGHQLSLDQSLSVMDRAAGNMGAFMEQTSRLSAIISKMSLPEVGQLKAKIDQIERELSYLNNRLENHGP